MAFKVEWIDRGAEPKEKPNPLYPNGVDCDLSEGGPNCSTALDYPAKRCGYWAVVCLDCGTNALVSTAGRADDPRSLKLRCQPRGTRH